METNEFDKLCNKALNWIKEKNIYNNIEIKNLQERHLANSIIQFHVLIHETSKNNPKIYTKKKIENSMQTTANQHGIDIQLFKECLKFLEI